MQSVDINKVFLNNLALETGKKSIAAKFVFVGGEMEVSYVVEDLRFGGGAISNFVHLVDAIRAYQKIGTEVKYLVFYRYCDEPDVKVTSFSLAQGEDPLEYANSIPHSNRTYLAAIEMNRALRAFNISI